MIKIEDYNNVKPSFDGESKHIAPRRICVRYISS